ncbi:hypothetical protein [Xanthobacter tagetidis]|uniref:hypothetical protein n=1 Tax=Xanthobacter tagetidis TaxID=60216 RepID=UPI0011C3DB68|nr:hypothetical protein [Xanthobacter tagetidis]MBB6308944.1 hypothetical protein [Xanthobacter tagetidis]
MVRTLGLRLSNPFRRHCPPAPGQAEPQPPRDLGCGSAPSPYPTDPTAAVAQQCALGAVHIGAGVGLLWLAGAAALFQATREMMEV